MPHPEAARKDGTNPDLWQVGANIYRNKLEKLEKPTYVDEFIAMAYETCASTDREELGTRLHELERLIRGWQHHVSLTPEPETEA